jgi:hypothetical protein
VQTYYPPTYRKGQFHCIHCGVFAAQKWDYFFTYDTALHKQEDLSYNICTHCNNWYYWYDGRMIVPCEGPVPPAHVDLPKACVEEYTEARSIVAQSPKAAAALLRLALQKLMIELGEKGKNINDDIGSLVSKGLPIEVQQALDYCRVVGNNAVHPGEIDLTDTPDIAHNLFEMMNFIVEERIARPKKVAQFYAKLPEGARQAIEKRDVKK